MFWDCCWEYWWCFFCIGDVAVGHWKSLQEKAARNRKQKEQKDRTTNTRKYKTNQKDATPNTSQQPYHHKRFANLQIERKKTNKKKQLHARKKHTANHCVPNVFPGVFLFTKTNQLTDAQAGPSNAIEERPVWACLYMKTCGTPPGWIAREAPSARPKNKNNQKRIENIRTA